jgi:hypothetical protein
MSQPGASLSAAIVRVNEIIAAQRGAAILSGPLLPCLEAFQACAPALDQRA